jgi:hypothetical protein
MLWCDGRLVEDGTLPFDMGDRGLLLGDGVFDTALAVQGRVAFETAHIDRLVAAASTLGYPADPERIRAAMRALAESLPLAAIRTTLTRGSGPRGLAPPPEPAPFLFASAAPARPGLFFARLRLLPTKIARNETSPVSRLKTLGYLDAVLAARGGGRAAGHRPGRASLKDRAGARPRRGGAPAPARRARPGGGRVRHQLPAPDRPRRGHRQRDLRQRRARDRAASLGRVARGGGGLVRRRAGCREPLIRG